MGKRPANYSMREITMLLLTYKPETTAVATVDAATEAKPKARREYNKKARHTRMKATLRTIFNMTAKEDGVEFTVETLCKRLQMPLRNQIVQGVLNPNNIKADVNATLKEIGGVVEVRREMPAGGRGRPYAVFTFDPCTLSTKGRLIRAEIVKEEAEAQARAEAKAKAAKK